MARLVDDLLDVARVTSGKLLLRRERVTLAAVVAAALETSRPALEAAGHKLLTRMPAAQAVVDADPTRLAQVLSNLLNNAAKYTPPGGTVELHVERAGSEAVLSVRDNGMGFPPELAAAAFRAVRAMGARGARCGGPGHRAVAGARHRRAARRHGERGERRAGKGQPLRGAPAARRRRAAHRAARAGRAGRAPPGVRVLVVDDNRDAADTLCRILALYGYEVRSAYDGAAALEVCESFRPHVAVLDIGMPVRSGYEVARELRARRGAGSAADRADRLGSRRRRAARPRRGLRSSPHQARRSRRAERDDRQPPLAEGAALPPRRTARASAARPRPAGRRTRSTHSR